MLQTSFQTQFVGLMLGRMEAGNSNSALSVKSTLSVIQGALHSTEPNVEARELWKAPV